MTDLLSLAERVEQAGGPDRKLDLAIARHFGVTVWKRNDEDTGNYETTYWRYTESVDAAMTLVPEGWLIEEIGEWPFPDDESRPWHAKLRDREWGKADRRAVALDCVSAPLALTAACLRALAQEHRP